MRQSSSTIDRRQFLSSTGLGLLAFHVGGSTALLTPRDARGEGVALRVLTPDDARTVDALGDTLLPGAADAGLSHYLDHQLAATAADSLLMLRYLDWPPPYTGFYLPCVAATNVVARAQYGKPYHDLESAERDAFVGALRNSDPDGWQGPPAPLFYFALRSDAVDVVYGTAEGFAKLGVPYMPHISPPTKW